MIRDPSDGSVRENPSKEIGLSPNETGPNLHETSSKEITGLPPLSSKPKDVAKLEKSREWLQNYKSQKGR